MNVAGRNVKQKAVKKREETRVPVGLHEPEKCKACFQPPIK